mmetsp:Transcript_115239/g.325638  ORF Transcript_115239/g.325638 Transcript_115239/m.325638 type:complete len:669 (-) Transcript_115239:97-2103(-)
MVEDSPTVRGQSLLEIFQDFDQNGDGFISRDELASVFRALDPVHWSDDRIDQLMEEVDINEDGFIPYEEFVAWLTSVHEENGEHLAVIELQSRKSFDVSTLIVDCREKAGDAERFTIHLEQDRRTKVGIKLDMSDTKMLCIKTIGPKGLVAQWNDDSPDRQVCVGDCIVSVNGISDCAADMLKELTSQPARGSRHLALVIHPKASAFRFVNRLAENYDIEREIVDEEVCTSLRWAVHRSTGMAHAIRSVHKRSAKMHCVEAEVESMKRLNHPNIVKLYEVFEDFHDIHLVVEKTTGGELLDRVIDDNCFAEWQVVVVMQQLFAGLAHLRAHCICHRDLRPENVLLQDDSMLEHCVPKITGFGYAKLYQPGEMFSTRVGEAMYMSPQVVDGVYDAACDVWSCGAIMYVLLVGYPPFAGGSDRETRQMVQQCNLAYPEEDWGRISEQAIDLVGRLLAKKPRDRSSPEDALEHEWTKRLSHKVSDIPLDDGQRKLRTFCGQNRLKKAALHAIAQRLTTSEIKELSHMFKVLDANGDSTITFPELKAGLDRLGQPESFAELRKLLEAVDVDGSKRIDYMEFIAATLCQRRFCEEDICWAAFRVFDRDGSGRICKNELGQVLHSGDVQAIMGVESIERALAETDMDGDGEIDFHEFMTLMRGNEDAECEFEDV